jgi:hypothetical protein
MILTVVAAFATANGLAAQQTAPEPEGPCKQIKEACQKAGFVQGEAKQGYGLWLDCVDPIVRGTAQPASAKKPLPAVGADVINACKAKQHNLKEAQSSKK